ncbi:MAG: 4-hydroxy-3-methylbut-2-enyl diphosphate reductase [Candidatus Portnoybacteria bacterium]|nr:4-hydroxy-3-methylbut-2-enyl diphosphate reductase [Candidatus Portnoybacteria bacterium]
MKIEIAKNAGFCFGVKRALALIEDNVKKIKKPISMYGHLVHNEEVIKRLLAKGIKVIDNLEKIRRGTLIITAHGISPKMKEELLKQKGLNLVDTTCPKVLLVQNLAKLLHKQGRQVLIFGDVDHQEVKGIKGAADDQAIVFSSEKEFKKINLDQKKKYGLVVQTTKDFEEFKKLEKKIKEKIKDIRIFNTICQATRQRQREVRELAKTQDLVLVVGSKTSANTTRLYQIGLGINPNTYFVATSQQVKEKWFKNKKRVGITAGASTPDWIINQVVQRVQNIRN